jgi:lysophospholipase L1-like esterase
MLPWRSGRALLLVAVLALVAGSVGAMAGTARATPLPQARPQPTYVALGDSFAAGPGIPDTTGGACLRSTANYPSLVAAQLHLSLTDVTCSGATTENVTTTAQGANPPQLQAVTRDTDYVTITIGNNDVAYTRSSIACGTAGATGAPCLGVGVDTGAIETALGHLEADLVTTLRAVRRAAPKATILLVTYPRTLPADGAPCPPQNPMLPDDSRYLTDLGAHLQRHLVAAASTAKRAKVTLVDTYRPTGHDVCSPEPRRWIEGAAPESPALLWHPNERGMQAQAARVVRAIRRADRRDRSA